MHNAGQTPPSLKAYALLIVLTVVAGALLVILPYPFSNIILFGMLLLAGHLALTRAGYTERQLLQTAWVNIYPTMRLIARTIQQTLLVLYRFNFTRQSATDIQPPVDLPKTQHSVPSTQRTPFSKPSAAASIGAFFGLTCGILLALVVVVVSLPLSILIAGVVIGVGFIATKLDLDILLAPRLFLRGLNRLLPGDWADIESVPRYRLAAELFFILVVALCATWWYSHSPPPMQISGGESEWLTSTVYTARDGLLKYGRIPLWQPLFEYGEPLIENPFSFIFNPFSSVPTLLVGGAEGLKISVILTAIIAGWGGWFLGRMLGLGGLGRLMLALLILGKGNMHAMINTGYFQLGVSQAYIPWVIASVIAVLRLPGRRWPIPMMAVSIMLLFYAGNIWYILPTVVGGAIVAGVYMVSVDNRRFQWAALRHLLIAGGLATGLSAATLIPIAVNFNRLGSHPPEVAAGWVIKFWENTVPLYFNPDPRQQMDMFYPLGAITDKPNLDRYDEFYFSFIVPGWFFLLIFVTPLYRPGRGRRLWLVAWILLALATAWGAGGQTFFLWLYKNVPVMGQWRFVGRALGVGSFWLAILVALRVDSLWAHITTTDWRGLGMHKRLVKWLPRAAAVGLLITSAVAAQQVVGQWQNLISSTLNIPSPEADRCLAWLRKMQGDRPLSVWQNYYFNIIPLQKYDVRTWQIQADYSILPMPNTIGNPEISMYHSLPEFGLARTYEDTKIFYGYGYQLMLNSPYRWEIEAQCIYQNVNALPYAYTLPLPIAHLLIPSDKDYTRASFPPDTLADVTTFDRTPDQIALIITEPRKTRTILTLQEHTYPGWSVSIDGKPAKMESFGGQMTVELPAGDAPVYVYFEYRPTLVIIACWITVITALGCMGYLLFGLPKRA